MVPTSASAIRSTRPRTADAWLRYRHTVPNYDVWRELASFQRNAPPGSPAPFAQNDRRQIRPRLVTDANPYNARQGRYGAQDKGSLEIDAQKLGLHWVGDLIVEADVEVQEDRGELMLDLVEGGQHYRCTIDLKTGQATLSAVGIADYKPTATTSVRGPGEYRVTFANVDDQLLLWVDGDLVEFEGGTAYDVGQIFSDRSRILPQTSDDDPGDLAPAGIGARNAKLSVTGLRIWRDIYYIADSWERNRGGDLVMDFRSPVASAAARLAVRAVAVASLCRTQSRRLPAGRRTVLRDGRQQRRKLRCPAVVQSRSPHRRPARRSLFGTLDVDRQSTVRVLAPLVASHPRHADSVPTVPEPWGYEVGEVEGVRCQVVRCQ